MKLFFVCLLAIFGQCCGAAQAVELSQTEKQLIIKNFGLVAFGSEIGESAFEDSIRKFEKNRISFKIMSNASNRKIFLDASKYIFSKISNLSLYEVNTIKAANILVIIENKNDILNTSIVLSEVIGSDLPRIISINMNAVGNVCFFITYIDARRNITNAYIVLQSGDDLQMCAYEELMQALGLGNDSDLAVNSIFNDKSNKILPTKYDLIMLDALYSPLLKSGATKKSAIATVRNILDN